MEYNAKVAIKAENIIIVTLFVIGIFIFVITLKINKKNKIFDDKKQRNFRF